MLWAAPPPALRCGTLLVLPTSGESLEMALNARPGLRPDFRSTLNFGSLIPASARWLIAHFGLSAITDRYLLRAKFSIAEIEIARLLWRQERTLK